jgi:hypothetical protein
MDAVWIVHGLPVALLQRVDEFRAQYENTLDFPNREEFHLNPQWAGLPDITLEETDRSTDRDRVADPVLTSRTDPLRRRSLT